MKQIDKNIPIPAETRGKKHIGAKRKYDFGKMEIGDSFIMNYSERMSVYSCLRDYNKNNGTAIKIKTAKEKEGQYRCWRVE